MLRKFSTSAVFANDLSDHCIVGAVRNTKISRSEPRISLNWGRIKQADNVRKSGLGRKSGSDADWLRFH